jgi:2-polyprenyl-3-methyl-5-hydroxy-6-metoxy-1,4-benzoquinol methylase
MNLPANVNLEETACPLCNEYNDVFITAGRDLLYDKSGDFTVVQCRTCELMRTNPRPTLDTIGYYYPDDYGPYIGTRVRDSTSLSGVKKFIQAAVRRITDPNSVKLPPLVPGRMLEIGCASGAFLHEMAGKGWQVQGVEFSEKAALAASRLGYQVHTGPLETAPSPDQQFDLIVGWMVLEHLHDPINSLRKLREWSKPGAWLALSVPNAGSLEFRLFQDKWYALQLPTHLYHFTPQSLEKTLQAGGWTLEKVYHQRTLSNFIGSLGWVLRGKGHARLSQKFIDFPEKSGLYTYIFYPLALLCSFFGQTGRMTIWAKKK